MTLPPPMMHIRRAARAEANAASSGSTPRPKRSDASECSPSRRAVRRTDSALKLALSSSTRVVLSVTSVSSPPITPASAMPRAPSRIIRSPGTSVRSTSSRVLNFSPSPAAEMPIAPLLMVSASNACSGWPSSTIT